MRMNITVDLGNDAMQTAAEVGYAINLALLQQSASAINPLNEGEMGTVRDTNGNTVGRWTVEDDSPPSERWRLWVDDPRCVLFRLHSSGVAEIATRAEPGDAWGPPIHLTEETTT